MSSFGFPELIILFVVVCSSVLVIWPACRVCKKAGFSPWLGLLALMPIILLWVLAVSEWPARRSESGAAA